MAIAPMTKSVAYHSAEPQAEQQRRARPYRRT